MLVDSIGFGIILPVLPRLIMELTGAGVDRAASYGGWPSFVYALRRGTESAVAHPAAASPEG
jgi:MFS transporter, DHA1 family, tetracycline resistance protein